MVTYYPTATSPPGATKDQAEHVAETMTFVHGVDYTVHALPDGRWQCRPSTTSITTPSTET